METTEGQASGHDPHWMRRYRQPDTFARQLAAADPSLGLVVRTESGVEQLYIWHCPSGTLRRLTDQPGGVGHGLLAPDGRHVFHFRPQTVEGAGHLMQVPATAGAGADVTPELPPFTLSSAFGMAGMSLSRDGTLLGFTAKDGDGWQVFVCALGPQHDVVGEPRRLYASERPVGGPLLSADGALAACAVAGQEDGAPHYLVVLDTATGQPVATVRDADGAATPRNFSPLPGDERLVVERRHDQDTGLVLCDARSGVCRELPVDVAGAGAEVLDWSWDGERLLLKSVDGTVPHLWRYDLDDGRLRRLDHPPLGRIWGAIFGPRGEILANGDSAIAPFRVIELDGETGAERGVVLAPSPMLAGHPMRSVSVPSSDGTPIQGWLGVPAGDGPFPAVLDLHGGPANFMSGGYWPMGQAWIDHGYAVLALNYRGSTTFGTAFERQIWGNAGQWELEDLAAARAWLLDQGIAGAGRVLLTGRSYGGYLTLLALGKQPGLWAGGVAVAAFADWTIVHEDADDPDDLVLMGGTPDQQPERYRAASPLTYVDAVEAPLLIVHGRRDVVCPPRSIELYRDALRALGRPVEEYWYDDGHWAADVEVQIGQQQAMLRFAARVVSSPAG